MATFKTLTQLIEMVRFKADIQNDGNHVSDDEITIYINDSIATLHSLLVDGTDGTLFAKNAGNLVKIGDYAWQLPSDFSQLVDVSVYTGGQYVRSIQADPQAYAALTQVNANGWYSRTQHFLQWNIEQGRAELFLFPSVNVEANDIAVRYIAEPPQLSLLTDTLNFPTFWYLWVVYNAAIQCSVKEESNPQPLMAERERVEKRIRDHIRNMTPTRVKHIRKVDQSFGFGLPTVNFRSGN